MNGIFCAIAPARWTILGLRLRPFALGHLILLKRIGSPFVCDGKALDLFALQTAVFICSRSYEEALDGIDDPGLTRAFARWRGKLFGHWWWPRRISLVEKWLAFESYMREGDWAPALKASENTRRVGLPFEQAVRVKLMERLGLKDSEVMNRGWAMCKSDFYTLQDTDGVLTVYDDAALDELRRMREQAAEFDRRLKTGEVQVRWQ